MIERPRTRRGTHIAMPAGGAPGTRARPAPIGRATWRLAGVIVFGAFAGGLDASVANIGLDTISRDLHAGLGRAQWVANGYLIALAVSLPACAWLGRKAGAGRLWLLALAAFTAASGLCAVAPTIDTLIGFRVVQGLAAGLLIPAGQTVLGRAVGANRLGRVMATLGVAVALAPALGPVAGGLVLHALSWRWLFLINLPIGVAGLGLGLAFVPRGPAGTAPPLDWPGFAYAGTGLPLVVYALTTAGATGTVATPKVLIPLAAGAGGLAAFALRTLRHPNPLLDLRLYRDPRYAAAGGTAAFTGALMFGCALLYPLYFQLLYGDGVVTTGLRLLSLGGGTALALPLCGRLTDRYGGGVVSLCGCLGTVAATVPFTVLPAGANPILVQSLLALLGMAIAPAAVPPGITAYATVRPEQLPDATAQINILQRLGGALGGAMFAVVLARGLPASTEHAFQAAFRWQAGIAVAASACAFRLWAVLRAAAVPGDGGREP